jgi:hypothetical protein
MSNKHDWADLTRRVKRTVTEKARNIPSSPLFPLGFTACKEKASPEKLHYII